MIKRIKKLVKRIFNLQDKDIIFKGKIPSIKNQLAAHYILNRLLKELNLMNNNSDIILRNLDMDNPGKSGALVGEARTVALVMNMVRNYTKEYISKANAEAREVEEEEEIDT